MPADPRFEEGAAALLRYLESPRGRIRTAALRRRLLDAVDAARWGGEASGSAPRALDVGCGAAPAAEALLERGFELTLTDPSEALLARAPGGAGIEKIAAPLEALPGALGERRFELVICHNVLEYLPDSGAALSSLARWLAPGGRISLAVLNGAQEPLRAAIRGGDLHAALGRVRGPADAPIPSLYGIDRRPLSEEALQPLLAARGLSLRALTGVCAVSDYLDGPSLAREQEVIALEIALGRDPRYAAVSRYLHAWISREDDR